jgi:hypothetical protein
VHSDLIIFSDGPKSDDEDREKVDGVREYCLSIKGFKSVEFRFKKNNKGLANSFIDGITEILNKHSEAIFIEDDNLLSEYFLSFMNQALFKYRDNKRVCCVTGYSYPVSPKPKQPYFIRGAETWTMATWKRGWDIFCSDSALLKKKIDDNNLKEMLNKDGFKFYEMLQDQIDGKIDSWGVRWWVSAFVSNMYCLYPNNTFVISIGYGHDSVHCKTRSTLFRSFSDLAKEPLHVLPNNVFLDKKILQSIRKMNKRLRFNNFLLRLKMFMGNM